MEGRIHVDTSSYVDLSEYSLPKTPLQKGGASVRFESRSEAACAILMERYLPWKLEQGVTYQIPLAQNKRADFMIEPGVIFEFHPIALHREFMSSEAKHVFNKRLKKLPDWLAKEMKEALQTELYYHYRQKRHILVKATPGLEDAELIVATDPEFFYKKIIRRFSDNPPSMNKLVTEWRDLIKNMKDKKSDGQD